ncbi:signal recognition particle subunit [Apophysomyces sp. BC1034]|nr:signal recognition particle subunit [Apophysomyces sp. BC1015]KAG0172048.1 signal recognition particle subunit [Apophysomyces sp. BC1021]KAG0185014.1 signal recognition particle subunit [Apophysomyces sp. BC1034]
MSMLQKLKETQKNPVFVDDDDIDNMDFPLPTEASSSTPNMNDIQNLMKSMQQPPAASQSTNRPIAVATTAQGVQRMDPSEYKEWVCVYPCYIDAAKTVKGGRRIVKEKAIEKPHAYFMALAVQKLGLSVVYESKTHARDWTNPGRVKVQLKRDRFFVNPNCTTRNQLYYLIAERMPAIQKESELPSNIVSPVTSLAEVEAIADEHRKAQGLPTLAEMNASSSQSPAIPSKPRKQKVKYVRG